MHRNVRLRLKYVGSALNLSFALGYTFTIWIYHFNPGNPLFNKIISYSPLPILIILFAFIYRYLRIFDIQDRQNNFIIKFWSSLLWGISQLVLIITAVALLIQPSPDVKAVWYSLDDLKWSGPFAIVLYPIVNLVVLLEQLTNLRWLVKAFSIPVLLVATALFLICMTRFKYYWRLSAQTADNKKALAYGVPILVMTTAISIGIELVARIF